jgi:FPC/CPF motif-containing protein YcgG
MTESLLFTSQAVAKSFAENSWQRLVFNEFASTLTSKSRPFPCVFGVAGFTASHLRFGFSEAMRAEDVAQALTAYLPECRRYGRNTSLVLFSRPGPAASLASYEKRFWALLRELSQKDEYNWSPHIPETLDHPLWEFCFNGEPIFVVCNTPAHVNRHSRRSSGFMLTFQPRWVFDDILGDPQIAANSTGKVRKRLAPYDIVPPSPALGAYGDPDNREWRQYFLGDDNRPATCPFHALRPDEAEKEVNKENAA